MTDISLAAHMRSSQFIYTYDAVVSTVMGVAFLTFAGPIADLAGWPGASDLLTAIGAFLLSWALFNYAIGTAVAPSWSSVLANIAGDAAWFLVSLLLLVVYWSEFSLLGHVLLAGQALFVAAVFLLKLRGAPAMRKR